MPRMKDRKPNKERAATFAARAAAGFTGAALSAFGTRCKNEAKWNEGRARTDARVGAHEWQLIAQQIRMVDESQSGRLVDAQTALQG